MFERLDVYDRKKTRTGKIIERKEGEILNKGEYIISVQCWIINNQGEILLTKRKLNSGSLNEVVQVIYISL